MTYTGLAASIWGIPGNLDTLKTMWREGASASGIARALGQGVTRNAVISKIHRLKLPQRVGDVRAKGDRIPRVRQSSGVPRTRSNVPRVPPAGRAGEIAKAREEAASGVAPEPIKTIVDEGPVISLIQLTEHTCKWPRGEPRLPGFGFCGAPPIDGKPYCQRHSDRALRR